MNDESMEREILTRKADLVRSRLEATLEELDRKRHEVLDTPLEVLQGPNLAVIAGSVATVIAAGVGLAIYRLARRPQRLRRERSNALLRLWHHPERAFQGGRGTSVWGELGRRILVGGGSFLAMKLLKRALDLALPPEHHEPAPLP